VIVGRLAIGVRTNLAATGSRLRRALARYVDDSVDVPANFSLRLAEKEGDFHFLYWGGRTVVRTLDAGRLLRGLLTFLAAHGDPDPGVVKLRSLGLVRDGRALLTPPGLKGSLSGLEPLLVRRGLVVVDGPWVLVDVAAAELLVGGTSLEVDRGPIDEIVATAPKGRPAPTVAPGRYPLAGWAFADPDGEVGAPVGRAEATVRALSLVPPGTPLPAGVVVSMGNLFARVPAGTLPMKAPQILVDTIDALARGA
jgi:hypothetical protein